MNTYKEEINSCIEAIEAGWQETDPDRARLKLMIAKLKAERSCIKFDIEREKLLMLCRCALADLEGIMPEYEPSGDKEHPAWKTIEELRMVFVNNKGEKRYVQN